MIGIIGAMEEEVTILKRKLNDMNEINIAHVKFYVGKLNHKEVVLTQSGIGKVNASISTTLLIEKFNPEVVINTGSAGALDQTLSIGDILVSNHDPTLLTKTMHVLEQQQLNGKVGMIVSGDSFIGSSEQRQKIKQQFPEAMAVEMEATAIAQTCYQFKVPFIVTRAVSDLANGKADISFEEFLDKAALSSSETVSLLVESL